MQTQRLIPAALSSYACDKVEAITISSKSERLCAKTDASPAHEEVASGGADSSNRSETLP